MSDPYVWPFPGRRAHDLTPEEFAIACKALTEPTKKTSVVVSEKHARDQTDEEYAASLRALGVSSAVGGRVEKWMKDRAEEDRLARQNFQRRWSR